MEIIELSDDNDDVISIDLVADLRDDDDNEQLSFSETPDSEDEEKEEEDDPMEIDSPLFPLPTNAQGGCQRG